MSCNLMLIITLLWYNTHYSFRPIGNQSWTENSNWTHKAVTAYWKAEVFKRECSDWQEAKAMERKLRGEYDQPRKRREALIDTTSPSMECSEDDVFIVLIAQHVFALDSIVARLGLGLLRFLLLGHSCGFFRGSIVALLVGDLL